MKLQNLTLKNFRCFSSESIEFSEYTPLLGPNNCGKSTVLRALDIFFQAASKSTGIVKEDFYVLKINEPLEISLTFSSLSDEETDDFKDPMLLEAALQTTLEKVNKIPALDQLVDRLKLFWRL